MTQYFSKEEKSSKRCWDLTAGQRAIAMMHDLDPEVGIYNIGYAWYVRSDFNWSIFQDVLRQLAARHPVLRSTYEWHDGDPVQVVHEVVQDFFEQKNISHLEEDDFLQMLSREKLHCPFKLDSEPPIHWTYYHHEKWDPVLFLRVHHIAVDGWSIMVLLNEIRDLYHALKRGRTLSLPEITHHHQIYLAEEISRLKGERGKVLLKFWRQYLGEDPPVLNLTPDKKRPPRFTFRGDALKIAIPEQTSSALKVICMETQISPFVMYLSVFKLLLRRYTGQHDITIGTPTAGRDDRFQRVISYYVNPVAIRSNIPGDPSFMSFFKELRDNVQQVLEHKDFPFPHVVGELIHERDPSRPPLVQVAFGFENANRYLNRKEPLLTLGDNGSEYLQMGDMEWERIHFRVSVDEFELLLKVVKIQEAYYVLLDYNTSLFETSTAKRMIRHYLMLLQSVARNPHQVLSALSIFMPEERQQILVAWNQTSGPIPSEYFHQMVARFGEETPGATAIICEKRKTTYKVLNEKANQLAHRLIELGVGPDHLVGIYMDRSEKDLMTILAILKAGGGYVPLDPNYPADRLAYMVKDSSLKVIVTHQHLVESLPPHQAGVVCFDDGSNDWDLCPSYQPQVTIHPENIAYVIYTSGSTGKPKGVLIRHHSLNNLISTEMQLIQMTPQDQVLVFASLNFDTSIWAICWGWHHGSTLHTGTRESLMGESLMDYLEEEEISLVLLPPSLLATFGRRELPKLKHLFVGGEACSWALAKAWSQGRDFYNGYGPTEITVWSNCSKLDGKRNPPIGKPVANVSVFVLDRHLRPVPIGVSGELVVGGAGVARGYLNRPDLTAAVFIPDPFSDKPGARMYKTGDLTRFLDDGEVEFLGRVDHQVKIRGYRIELGEIETAVRDQELARDCLVLVRKENGSDILVAYVVREAGLDLDANQIAEALRQTLLNRMPEYMVPTAFLVLDAFPMTSNEKIDRRKLTAMPLRRVGDSVAVVAPRTPVEEVLVGIWADALKLESLGVTENFFTIGGHSLLATRIISRMKAAFQVAMPLPEFFKHQTIAASAVWVANAVGGEADVAPIKPVKRTHETSLSFAQRQLWFIDQLNPGNAAYNIPVSFKLSGPLNLNAFRSALEQIVQRHEILRTTFPLGSDGPIQHVNNDIQGRLEMIELRELPAEEWRTEVEREAVEEGLKPFDLAHGPLFRFSLLGLSETEHVFLLTLHHIIGDGWSVGIFLNELMHGYEAAVTHKPSLLPALAIQHIDYTYWQHQRLQGETLRTLLDFWKNQLADNNFVLELPADRSRPPEQSFSGACIHVAIDPALTHSVKALSQQKGATLFMTLFSAFNVLLYRYSRQCDLLVGTPIANRGSAELETQIGCYVSTLVLRSNLDGSPGFDELLDRVRTMTLDAYAHQDLPFQLLVEEIQPSRDLSRNPIFQVMFGLQNAPMPDFQLKDLTLGRLEIERGMSHFDLEVSLVEVDGGISGTFEYCTALFDRARITRMVGHYKELLKALTLDPTLSIDLLALMSESEKRQLLVDRNDTAFNYPRARCFHQLFEERAAKSGSRAALQFEDVLCDYDTLNRRANQLASYLRRKGVRRETMVGLCMERGIDMVVGLLAIMKAGGAYVPMDPGFPRDRLAYMIADAEAPILLTQSSLVSYLSGGASSRDIGAELVLLDGDNREIAKEATTNLTCWSGPQQLAYVIYTSGSTGKPKGVQLSQQNLVNFLISMAREPGFTKKDVLVAVTTLSFDIAGLELYLPLLVGGKVVLVGRDVAMDGERLLAVVRDCKATHLQATPVTWRLLLAAGWGTELPLKILCGGEPMPPELAVELVERGELWNVYGPTETTIWSTLFRVRSGHETISIGWALNNTQIYILDANLEPVPEGVPGELFIGGEGVARGYFKRGDLTAEKFVPHPFAIEPGDRIYATGDLARYMADGNLECLGRMDHQVKVRGYRIELGEIESVLIQHEQVRQVVVIVREDTPGDQRLVAYVAPAEDVFDSADLVEHGKESLPSYMIPTVFVRMDDMPLTPNGKVDRKALPKPDEGTADPADLGAAPVGKLEHEIAKIWCEVLKRDRIGVDLNFFDVGGNSLLLTSVAGRLRKLLNRDIPVITLFQHTTIKALAEHLGDGRPEAAIRSEAGTGSREAGAMAVIGMSGRFPMSPDLDRFWDNLAAAREMISVLSDEEVRSSGVDAETLADPDYIKARGILEDVSMFDHQFFGYSPREAAAMDPQQRLFLESSWTVLENAGYGPGSFEGRVGVFAGVRFSSYFQEYLRYDQDMMAKVGPLNIMVGNDKDYLTTRVSYQLDLKGPSFLIQTACSSSLVAVHQACQSLAAGDCDMALAGGVSISLPQKVGYLYEEGSIFSPDGHCRAFDANAAGTVGGSGVGVIVLKPLKAAVADGDTLHGVIYGSAINNDGAAKVGFTAPSVTGQRDVIVTAHQQAAAVFEHEIHELEREGLMAQPDWMTSHPHPRRVTYLEAHGTGTNLGDPTEMEALIQAFELQWRSAGVDQPLESGYCAVGSLKTNIGHLDPAAGVAGLIKTILALRHKTIPASLHYHTPNPNIPFGASPFFVNAETREWTTPGFPRIAGVSSFGIGGTNAHVVVQEAPEPEHYNALLQSLGYTAGRERIELDRPRHLLVVSAKSASALERITENMVSHLKRRPDQHLADVAYTLQMGRKAWEYRRMVVVGDHDDAVQVLETQSPKRLFSGQDPKTRDIVFMFSGQGSQYPGMGRELYQTEMLYRDIVDACAEHLLPLLGRDLRQLLLYDHDQIDAETQAEAAALLGQTEFTQPALFVVEYALASLWMSLGVRPTAMIGHSIGEYTAACLAGVFSWRDALNMVVARGKLMQAQEAGDMLAVPGSESEVEALLEEHPLVCVATINAPGRCVVGGPTEAVAALKQALSAKGIEATLLHTSHAFHSAMMEPARRDFVQLLAQQTFHPPCKPFSAFVDGEVKQALDAPVFISNLTGDWAEASQITTADYWGDHLRRPVRFSDGMQRLVAGSDAVFLEVGPGRTLEVFAKAHLEPKSNHRVYASMRHPKKTDHDLEVFLTTLGRLWLDGTDIQWSGLYSGTRQDEGKSRFQVARRRVPLPGYPFERTSHWVTPTRGPRALGSGDQTARAVGSVGDGSKKPDLGHWFYQPVWRPLSRPVPDVQSQSGPWLIFARGAGDPVTRDLILRLAEAGQTLIVVEPVVSGAAGPIQGKQKKTSAGHDFFHVRMDQADDYEALFKQVYKSEERKPPKRIIYAWSLMDQAADHETCLEYSFYCPVLAVKALSALALEEPIRIDFLSNGAGVMDGDGDTAPARSLIGAPAKIVPMECPKITCRHIDLPPDCTKGESQSGSRARGGLLDQILEELFDGDLKTQVYCRKGQRFEREFLPVYAPKRPEGWSPLAGGDIILISGGLSAVGLELATQMAESYAGDSGGLAKPKFLLLGRSPFPAADDADPVRSAAADYKRNRVNHLRQRGCEVHYLQADVTSEAALREALATVKVTPDQITGVIHAAGVTGGRVLANVTRESAAQTLAPKVDGALALGRLLGIFPTRASDPCPNRLKLMVMCSSINAVGGGIGQTDYCAANLFLDSFAWTVSNAGLPCLSINWDTWAEVGMAANMTLPASLQQKYEALMKKAMRPAEAREVFGRILGGVTWPQVLISTNDFKQKLQEIADFLKPDPAPVASGPKVEAVHDAGDPGAPRTETERIVAAAMADALGFERLGAFDDFVDKGGDSLLATSIAAQLRKALKVKLSAGKFMELSSVEAIAAEIDQMLGRVNDLPSNTAVKSVATQLRDPFTRHKSAVGVFDNAKSGGGLPRDLAQEEEAERYPFRSKITLIWQQILGVEIKDHERGFLDLGGDAATAEAVDNAIIEAYRIPMGVELLLNNITLNAFADQIQAVQLLANGLKKTSTCRHEMEAVLL